MAGQISQRMNKEIKKQILFVLEDDNEVMTAAWSSDLDEENKRMNRELIKEHEKIIAEVEQGKGLTQKDLVLIRDANEIHLNDAENLQEHHWQAVKLNQWLEEQTKLGSKGALKILENYLDNDKKTPALVYKALHTLWEEANGEKGDEVEQAAFDNHGKCLKCGSKVSFADVTDTIVFVDNDIVKRHNGDISNRNCVRCTYPKQYDDYKHYDEAGG